MSKVLKNVLLHVVVVAIIFAEIAFSAQPVFNGAEVVEFDSVSYTYAPSPFRIKQAKKWEYH
jgi:hypothetical protein